MLPNNGIPSLLLFLTTTAALLEMASRSPDTVYLGMLCQMWNNATHPYSGELTYRVNTRRAHSGEQSLVLIQGGINLGD